MDDITAAVRTLLEGTTPGPWPNVGHVGCQTTYEVVRALVPEEQVVSKETCRADTYLLAAAPALANLVLDLADLINTLEVTATGLHMDGSHQAKIRWGRRLTPEQWALIHACRPQAPVTDLG